MESQIEIRRAVPADARTLAGLRWEFRAHREPPVQTVETQAAFVERCAGWMARELGGSSWHVWVAVRRSRIVGQLWMQLVSKIPNPVEENEYLAYISNVFVLPSERGGVGTQLLETALAFALDHDVDRIVLWPSSRSVTLYERHGFRRVGDVMELALSSR